jgi:6-carboxyhexanoate--CoA ligase
MSGRPSEFLHSVRMRAASAGGAHLCGAERIVPPAALSTVVQELLDRALAHGAAPHSVHISIDRIPADDIVRIPCLPVTTVPAADPAEARALVEPYLIAAGVSPDAVAIAFDGLIHGLGPNGSPMRGAAVMDCESGTRLEPDPARGLRASHLDYAPDHRDAIRQEFLDAGLPHHRTWEAVAVASKVIWAGVTAELCWSDDPDYDTGYVATREAGYVRFPKFKPMGATGGRVWFVLPNSDRAALAHKTEQICVMVEGSATPSSAAGYVARRSSSLTPHDSLR